jgi:aminopeptidase N
MIATMIRKTFLGLGLLLSGLGATAQSASFTHADSLRGSLRPERTCYDVDFYDLKVKVDPATERISGSNDIHFATMQDFMTLQIDLFDNMLIDMVTYNGQLLTYRRDAHAVFVDFPSVVKAPTQGILHVEYSGSPIAAARAPWDGGFVWKKDGTGKPYVGVACEGTGASLWWPCKDYLGDEPDSMRITVIAPIGLKTVCNGVQRSVKDLDAQWTQTEWFVSYPINNYNVTLNIADYVHWADTFRNASGVHDLDYYVLRANEAKAKVQFEQVKPMMRAYEKHFGEYPFWRDGYALVETSYLGMEHQGAIAYGNNYLPGYLGMDALGLKFDYIIIHETGHEWWGNSVSCADHAELWIHEGFCTYSEAVYVEELWGKETATRYLMSQRGNIMNSSAIVGPLGVNFNDWSGSDMYYKGAWMLHTLRNQVNDDALWWKTIYAFATEFKLKNTNTVEVIAFFNQQLGKDYTWLMREYLYHAKAPVLVYDPKAKGDKTQMKYKWEAGEPGFKLSIPVKLPDGSVQMITPTTSWQKILLPVSADRLQFDGSTWYGKLRNLKK